MDRTSAAVRLLGASAGMRLVRQQIEALGPVDTTVLIEGEVGTGKGLVAQLLHAASRRWESPFLALNGVGRDELLLASQWFGHTRGAFVAAPSDRIGLFEAARGGTLLLDEIADLSLRMQSQLLRVLQEREILRVGDSQPRPIDVRVLAATHRPLDREVAAGRFREDLLYRIRVARIVVPPLRDRAEDIPALARAFLREAARTQCKAVDAISAGAMGRLTAHRWPGNVRELHSTIEWAVIRAVERTIRIVDLPPEFGDEGVPPPHAPPSALEQHELLDALRRAGGNRSLAARLLGISRATLYRRLAAFKDDDDAHGIWG